MRLRLVLFVLAIFALAVDCFAQQTFEVRHFAGSPGGVGTADSVGADARFQNPSEVWGDGTYLYVSDQSGHAIRRVTIATGDVRLVAGSLTSSGFADGSGDAARFNNIRGFWGDETYLYIADCSNGRVRRMTLATADVVTIAGSGPGTPVDGPAPKSVFRCPLGISGNGRFLYVTDRSNHVLRRIDRRTGEVKTVAGIAGEAGVRDAAGDKARFNNPTALCSDGTALYVADSGNATIRKVTIRTWKVETIAGTPGVPGKPETSHFINPAGLWCDKNNIYVSDYGSISRIAIATGKITVLVSGLSGSGPLWNNGQFLYFSDRGLKKLNLSTLEVTAVNSLQLPEAGNVWGDGRDQHFFVQRFRCHGD